LTNPLQLLPVHLQTGKKNDKIVSSLKEAASGLQVHQARLLQAIWEGVFGWKISPESTLETNTILELAVHLSSRALTPSQPNFFQQVSSFVMQLNRTS
jgi:hypothetical protein